MVDVENPLGEGAWIGVDFDGTIAHTHTHEAIPEMVARVNKWLKQGLDIRILTARANKHDPDFDQKDVDFVRKFCKSEFGKELPITDAKDMHMIELWDDRAVQVGRNTGKIIGKEFRRNL